MPSLHARFIAAFLLTFGCGDKDPSGDPGDCYDWCEATVRYQDLGDVDSLVEQVCGDVPSTVRGCQDCLNLWVGPALEVAAVIGDCCLEGTDTLTGEEACALFNSDPRWDEFQEQYEAYCESTSAEYGYSDCQD